MKHVKSFQIRGLDREVQRLEIDGRTIDFWSPEQPCHLIIAHDGNNVFDKKTSTLGTTWRLAERSSNIFSKRGMVPPAIIGVYHKGDGPTSPGRISELSPQQPFLKGIKVLVEDSIKLEELSGDAYQAHIANVILPAISKEFNIATSPKNTAMLGSSMGALATLYGMGLRPDLFHTALAFSPHFPIGGIPLVDWLLDELPTPENHKVWMSRGTRSLDSTYGPFQDHANRKMNSLGWGQNYRFQKYKGAGHNERAWSKQLEDAISYWLEQR